MDSFLGSPPHQGMCSSALSRSASKVFAVLLGRKQVESVMTSVK